MLLFNIILILILLGFVAAGLKDGFVIALGRLLGAVLGFLAAKAWYMPVAMFFSKTPSGWVMVICFILIFMLIIRLTGLLFKALDATYKFLALLPFMKSINKLFGGVLGLLEGVMFMGGLIWVNLTFSPLLFLVPYLTGSVVASLIYKTFMAFMWLLL